MALLAVAVVVTLNMFQICWTRFEFVSDDVFIATALEHARAYGGDRDGEPSATIVDAPPADGPWGVLRPFGWSFATVLLDYPKVFKWITMDTCGDVVDTTGFEK